MRKPNLSEYNPDPEYLRELIKASGMSQGGAATSIGVSARTMREYVRLPTHDKRAPYPVQYALEALSTNKCPECLDWHLNLIKGDYCDECAEMLDEMNGELIL